jgi:hypothetical protein
MPEREILLTNKPRYASSGLHLDYNMTVQVAAFDAKQKLSELLNRANGGETIVITVEKPA